MDAFDADVLIYAGAAGHPLLELRGVDPVTAEVATALAIGYRLRAADAVHLATAIIAGADRFITDNRRDFSGSISEIDVTYPDELDEP